MRERSSIGRPKAPWSVLSRIEARLRKLYSESLGDPIPKSMLSFVKQLEERNAAPGNAEEPAPTFSPRNKQSP